MTTDGLKVALGVVTAALFVMLGMVFSGTGQLGSECARICGPDHFRCSIARPDEPRGGRLTRLATDTAPGIDFTLSYSGVICSFSYINSQRPDLNFTVGLAEEPAPIAPEPEVETEAESDG